MNNKDLHPTLKDNRVVGITFLDKDENQCFAVGVYVKEDDETVEVAFNACGNKIKDYVIVPKKNIVSIEDINPIDIKILR